MVQITRITRKKIIITGTMHHHIRRCTIHTCLRTIHQKVSRLLLMAQQILNHYSNILKNKCCLTFHRNAARSVKASPNTHSVPFSTLLAFFFILFFDPCNCSATTAASNYTFIHYLFNFLKDLVFNTPFF